jgi:hypothetical protein
VVRAAHAQREESVIVSTPESELRATSDVLLRALDELAALESEKRTLAPDDPRFPEVASQVETLATTVMRMAALEKQLADTAHVMAQTGEPDAPTLPIDATHRPLHEILDDWRTAERDLAQTEPGSIEAAEAQMRVHTWRQEYRRAFDEARLREDGR